VPTVLIKPVVE